MGYVSGEQWEKQQADVWGDKDPDVFRRVVERIQRQEPEVLREVERMMEERVPPHALLQYVTNSILRGVDNVMPEPPEGVEMTDCSGRVWDRISLRWVEKGPKTGPAVSWNRTTGA